MEDGIGESISLQGDFLANLSATQGSEEARQMTVRSGRKCSELSEKRTPLGLLEKMLLESSEWNSTRCYLTWQISVMGFGRLLFQLVPWTRRTDECASGLWRTPDASMTTGGAANALDRKEQGHAISLADQVNTPEMWPSPRASDYKGSGPRGSKSQKHMEDRQYLCATAATAESGSLNPDWVEWLMGYPETWTEV